MRTFYRKNPFHRMISSAVARSAFAGCLLAVCLGACRTEPVEENAPAVQTTPTTSPYEAYGTPFEPDDAVPVQAVATEPASYLDRPVKVEGVVAEVCQVKGCWLTFRTTDGNTVRITVPRLDNGDYVFTVPKDISGRKAVVQGTLTRETLSEDSRRHLAEDAGKALPDGDVAPVEELRLVATGVLVENAAT